MYKAELELEKRLNDIALANVPSTSFENIVIVPKKREQAPLEMSPDEFDLRDLMLEQRMNVIAMNSVVDKLGWKPSKIKSDVTKEMIADFQLEQMKNIKDGLYVPPSLDLDLLDEPFPIVRLTRNELRDLTAELQRISAEMDYIQQQLATTPERRREFDLALSLEAGAAIRDIDASGINALQRAKAKRDVRKQEESERAKIQARAETALIRGGQEYAELESQYRAVERIIRDNDKAISDYQSELAEVQKENARRRRIYEDAVKSVNQGRNFIAMLPNETADEYKQRLKDIGASTANTDAIQAAASLLYTDRLRERMAEITRDDVLVNTFIKVLNTDQRYLLTKIFDTFKKKVLEIFGFDNKKMSVDDLSNIGEELTDNAAAKALAEPAYFKVDDRPEPLVAVVVEEGSTIPKRTRALRTIPASAGSFELRPNNFYQARIDAIMEVSRGGKPKEFQGDKKKAREGNELVLLYLSEIERAKEFYKSSRGGTEVSLEPVREAPAVAAPLSPRIVELPSLAELQREVQETIADQDVLDRLLEIRTANELIKEAKKEGVSFKFEKVGRGLSGRSIHAKYPKIVPFGLIEISPHKLFYENILKITRKGKHLTGFPNVKVSNDFVSFMFKILDGDQPTMRDVNKLSVGEKQLFDSVVFTAGLQKKVESTGSGVKQDLKNRLALIEGSIEAGNTSDELIKEARKILQHLARMRIIGHRAAASHLKQLISAQRG
jgi:hypothetical protein